MTDIPRSPTTLLRAVRGIPPEARWGVVREQAGKRLSAARQRAHRRLVTGTVRAVELGLGPASANRYFWRNPIGNQPWYDVEQRLERLANEHPDHVAAFIELSCSQTTDPTALFGLARHPESADSCRQWLIRNVPGDAQARRLAENRIMGAAVAGAARLLLDPDDASAIERWVSDLYQLTDPRLYEVLDSFGLRPTGAPSTRPKRRLVIAEHAHDRSMLGLMVPGADSVTLVSTADTFGQADFLDWAAWTGGDDLVVEHIRTRITRFSSDYIELHRATADVARSIGASLAERTDLVTDEERPFVEVDVADFLFFQALKLRALEELLADDMFDHIVVALADQRPGSEFLDLLGRVDGLADDPRVELVSISRSTTTRTRFWSQVDAITAGGVRATAKTARVPDDIVLSRLDGLAEILADDLPRFAGGARPRVLVVTANNSAYNESTAHSIASLDERFDVRVAHVGRNATDLSTLLGERGVDVDLGFLPVGPQHVVALAAYLAVQLSDVLDAAVHNPGDDRARRAASAAAAFSFQRLLRQSLAPSIARIRVTRAWFRAMSESETCPDVVVLTPSRTVGVGSVTATARRFGVPSIILEPHAHDANYCRYLKITSDYYGVMSDYFRSQAIAGLGTEPDRTFVVGSPRQIAPPDYDPASERVAARRSLLRRTGIDLADGRPALAFFCQPSDWHHVAVIWSHVLRGAATSGWRVLLKTHPEEAPSRVRQYLSVARDLPGIEPPIVVDVDAATSIALSDAVVTAYSAAGIDAALRATPVVVVTDGHQPYPVDLSRILGAPVADSADELAALLDSIRTEPVEWDRRARTLLDRESQFTEGPERRLLELVDAAIQGGPAAIRPGSDVPSDIFLDPPHPVFPV